MSSTPQSTVANRDDVGDDGDFTHVTGRNRRRNRRTRRRPAVEAAAAALDAPVGESSGCIVLLSTLPGESVSVNDDGMVDLTDDVRVLMVHKRFSSAFSSLAWFIASPFGSIHGTDHANIPDTEPDSSLWRETEIFQQYMERRVHHWIRCICDEELALIMGLCAFATRGSAFTWSHIPESIEQAFVCTPNIWSVGQSFMARHVQMVVEHKDFQSFTVRHAPIWDLPKGKIDAGETPVEAAARELCEETLPIGSYCPDELLSCVAAVKHCLDREERECTSSRIVHPSDTIKQVLHTHVLRLVEFRHSWLCTKEDVHVNTPETQSLGEDGEGDGEGDDVEVHTPPTYTRTFTREENREIQGTSFIGRRHLYTHAARHALRLGRPAMEMLATFINIEKVEE